MALENALAEVLITILARTDVRAALREAIGQSSADEWIDRAKYEAEHPGAKWRVVLDAGRRGQIAIGHRGHTPVVRRAELDRWMSRCRSRSAPTPPDLTPREAAALAVARAAERVRHSR